MLCPVTNAGACQESSSHCHASYTFFAAGCLGNPGEELGVGARPELIDNIGWVLQLFSPWILSPS